MIFANPHLSQFLLVSFPLKDQIVISLLTSFFWVVTFILWKGLSLSLLQSTDAKDYKNNEGTRWFLKIYKKSLHVYRILHSVLSDWWIVHLYFISIRSHEFRFVPSFSLIRSFELRIVLSILSIQSERINCRISYPWTRHTNPWKRITYPWGRIPILREGIIRFEITIYYVGFFFKSPFPFSFCTSGNHW